MKKAPRWGAFWEMRDRIWSYPPVELQGFLTYLMSLPSSANESVATNA